ncbi:MAG: AbgT family transporter [Chloroflexi bacterium]|nr:AbgT family transporter [Chloroflexota bacterium]
MTQPKSGAQISTKAFLQAVAIIFFLMMAAGILTRVVPAGQYTRVEVDGRQVIDATSFTFTNRPNYPVWRWFTAPFEVLGAEGNITVIAIILFILLVGVAFAVMDKSGILKSVISRIIKAFGGRKYALMLVITFFFMALGAFFGIFEEVIPLVPIIIALAFSLGWDSLIGLGMSILATNVGFSMAVFNPFTIGVSQKLAGLPMFSGALPRLALFIVGYVILALFMRAYAKKIDKHPEASSVFQEDQKERVRLGSFEVDKTDDPSMRAAIIFLVIFFALILAMLVASPFITFLSDYALPITGLLFVIGGIGAGLIAGVGKAVWDGFLGIAPAVPLLMMAASVRYIVQMGGILDTILHWASTLTTGLNPFTAAMTIYGLTLVMELFITSGSAKALLLIPILIPLADLVHVNRQIAVSAYCFGDGFSNLVYPTNAALLITLSLTVVPYHKWVKWLLALWFWIFLATVAFLALAVAFGYGPF